MACRSVAALAAAVLIPLTACDLTQKPQTFAAQPVAAQRIAPGVVAGAPAARVDMQDSSASESTGVSERSIRLYGPGVSRSKQTRI